MVTIEDNDDDSSDGHPQFQAGAGTQAAADALIGMGFGAISGERNMTPEQVFKQSQEKKQRYFNSLAGDIQGLSDDEEEEMIDFNIGWNEGEQLARQQQVKSPMQIETTSATNPRRVTLSHQKKGVINPYKKVLLLIDGTQHQAVLLYAARRTRMPRWFQRRLLLNDGYNCQSMDWRRRRQL